MKKLTCDVCKAEILSPVVERNYYHLGHRDICEKCRDKLEASIKPKVRTHQPFDYTWYQTLVQSTIENGVKKGKITD